MNHSCFASPISLFCLSIGRHFLDFFPVLPIAEMPHKNHCYKKTLPWPGSVFLRPCCILASFRLVACRLFLSCGVAFVRFGQTAFCLSLLSVAAKHGLCLALDDAFFHTPSKHTVRWQMPSVFVSGKNSNVFFSVFLRFWRQRKQKKTPSGSKTVLAFWRTSKASTGWFGGQRKRMDLGVRPLPDCPKKMKQKFWRFFVSFSSLFWPLLSDRLCFLCCKKNIFNNCTAVIFHFILPHFHPFVKVRPRRIL